MAIMVEYKTDKGPVLFEVSSAETNVRGVSVVDGVIGATQKLEDAIRQQVTAFADATYTALKGLGDKLEKAELELGLSVTGKGSVYFVQAEANASVKVKLIFNLVPTKP